MRLKGTPLAPWLDTLTHPAAVGGVIVAGSWIFRRRGKTLIQLVAGLVAILARDKRSRADRAMEVLRAISAQEADVPKTHDRHHVVQERSLDEED